MRAGGRSHQVVRIPTDLEGLHLLAAAEDTLVPAEANDQECDDGLSMAPFPVVSLSPFQDLPLTLTREPGRDPLYPSSWLEVAAAISSRFPSTGLRCTSSSAA